MSQRFGMVVHCHRPLVWDHFMSFTMDCRGPVFSVTVYFINDLFLYGFNIKSIILLHIISKVVVFLEYIHV